MLKSHYQKGMYDCDKPYRDFIIAVLKKYGKTSFINDEFWTLGGYEGHEYKFLIKNGIKFNDGTYHSVDRGPLLQVGNMVRHQYLEFMDIWKIWENPSVIAYDSIDGIVDINEDKWRNMIALVSCAMRKVPDLVLIVNYATSFGNIKWKNIDPYHVTMAKWVGIIDSLLTNNGYKVDHFPTACLAKRSNGLTEMLSFAFRIFK